MADDQGAPVTSDPSSVQRPIEKQFPFDKQLAALTDLRQAVNRIRDAFVASDVADEVLPFLETLDHSTAVLESRYHKVAALFSDLLQGLPNIGDKAHRVGAYLECTREDGIPIIWVPGAALAHLLLDAPDRDARVAILLSHEAEILDDCEARIDEVTAPPLQNMARLGRSVLGALRAGYPEPAQALAVNLCEQTIRNGLGPGSYRVHTETIDELQYLPLQLVRSAFCLYPVLPFYRGWWPDRADALPPFANRHVSVHQPTDAHSREHAVVAVMLMSSLLREWQAFDGEDGAFLDLLNLSETPPAAGTGERVRRIT